MGSVLVLDLYILRDRRPELWLNGDDALLIALTQHFDLGIVGVDIGLFESHQFGAAHTGTIEQFYHYLVTCSIEACWKLYIFQQPLYVALLDKYGKSLLCFRG